MGMQCEICGHKQEEKGYDWQVWTCEKCGQKYGYIEDHAILLTDDQRALLKAFALKAPTYTIHPDGTVISDAVVGSWEEKR